jgi:methyl-accepting chemotaxis protein
MRKGKKNTLIEGTAKPKQEMAVVKRGLIERIFSKNPIIRVTQKRDLEVKMEQAFKRMHYEFHQREQQMEVRLQAITLQNQQLKQRSKWFIPMLFAAGLAGAYMLFVLTNMQYSMSNMTGDIGAMNGYMKDMSGNTSTMSQDMQSMNQSMSSLNGNIGNMTGDVTQMSEAMKPMGDVAKTATPFTNAFRSLMPF